MKLLTKVKDTTIGCDPEVFFINRYDLIHSAVGLIGGNKEKPLVVPGGALQEDNVMAEFNTDPVTTEGMWLSKITQVYGQLKDIAIMHNCTIGKMASKHLLEHQVIGCDKASEFGCDPDFNAYSRKQNRTPDAKSLLRTCAGHIHIGYDIEGGHTLERSADFSKYMDAYVGTWCVVNDKDTRRMSRYGRAGAFRPKPYGTEYRVPSNFWLQSTELQLDIFRRTRNAYRGCQEGFTLPPDVPFAINNQDTDRCKEILACLL